MRRVSRGLRESRLSTSVWFALAVAPWTIAAGTVASACGTKRGEQGRAERERPLIDDKDVRRIPAPRGSFFDDPTWVPARRQLVVTVLSRQASELHLYTVSIRGGPLRRLPLSGQRGCTRTTEQYGSNLPDGTLGFVQYCLGAAPENAVTLRAYDWRTGKVRRLVRYHLPYFVGRYSFDPQMRRGVINDGRGLSERLQWLRPARLEPFDLK